jgi:hypothetical protein
MYIAVALIAGLIAVLAVAFYYNSQLNSTVNKNNVSEPVATLFVTTVVTVTENASITTCPNNQTMLTNETGPC